MAVIVQQQTILLWPRAAIYCCLHHSHEATGTEIVNSARYLTWFAEVPRGLPADQMRTKH